MNESNDSNYLVQIVWKLRKTLRELGLFSWGCHCATYRNQNWNKVCCGKMRRGKKTVKINIYIKTHSIDLNINSEPTPTSITFIFGSTELYDHSNIRMPREKNRTANEQNKWIAFRKKNANKNIHHRLKVIPFAVKHRINQSKNQSFQQLKITQIHVRTKEKKCEITNR